MSTFVENYQRMGNTVVSGSQLLSYLKGPDVRALEFSAQVNNNPIVSAAVGPTGTFLDASHLVQATVSSLLVSPATAGGTGFLNLGPDTSDNDLFCLVLLEIYVSEILPVQMQMYLFN